MDPTPADTAQQAIEQAASLTDPAERARAITAILKAVDGANLRNLRQEDLRKLYPEQNYREIGEQVGLTTGRVEQIIKGRITGRRRSAAATE